MFKYILHWQGFVGILFKSKSDLKFYIIECNKKNSQNSERARVNILGVVIFGYLNSLNIQVSSLQGKTGQWQHHRWVRGCCLVVTVWQSPGNV